MSNFLVFYTRGQSTEPVVERIDDHDEAVQRLLEAERELAGNPARGVVMLVAEDEDDLRRTHAHYFLSIEELLSHPAA
jgi:hypothetical protein